MKKVYVTGAEFRKKLLEGERDFSNVQLEERVVLTFHPYQCPIDSDGKPRQVDPELLDFFGELHSERGDGKDLKDNPYNFSGSIMVGLVAQGLYLPNLVVKDTNMQKSNFEQSFLEDADFSGSNLDYIHFRNSCAQRAKFKGCKLRHAYFSGWLNDTDFSSADLSHASIHGICGPYDFGIENVNFEDATLVRTDLSGNRIRNTNFKRANLRYANLSKVHFGKGIDFSKTDLSFADLSDVLITGVAGLVGNHSFSNVCINGNYDNHTREQKEFYYYSRAGYKSPSEIENELIAFREEIKKRLNKSP